MEPPLTPPGPVLCFGEILWDLLPHGTFPGGAPFNVAYHLHQLGVNAVPVSSVGRDAGGAELIRRLEGWGISTAAIARDPSAPTGTVTATLGENGDAHYTIAEDVAWDHLPADSVPGGMARAARGLVFGSLALRSSENRKTLARLAEEIPQKAWRVFDVNLRPPFDDLALVRRFAPLANVLKLNSLEAARLATGTRSFARTKKPTPADSRPNSAPRIFASPPPNVARVCCTKENGPGATVARWR